MIEGLLLCITNNHSQIRIHDADIQPGIHARGALLELGAAGVQRLPAVLLRRDAQCQEQADVPASGACGWNRRPHLIPSTHSAPRSRPAPERS
ncbi:MAG: hypothetical protein M0038_08815 [Pseudomonadota bacterium]|nr:hypothetical protein [Pseudomonadota bacterium]